MNRTKQESPPIQNSRDEMNGFSYHQPSNETDIFLLEAIAKQVVNSEIEAAKAIANIQDQIEELVMMFSTEAQKKTRAYADKENKIEAKQEAKAELEEKARAYEKLLETNNAEATAKAEFEAEARVEIEKKLHAQTQAKVEAEKNLKAEIQARYRAEQQAKSEAQERAKAETRVQVQAKVIANVQAQMEELAMMFRTEAQKKTRAYIEKVNKIEAEQETKAEPEEKARAYDTLPAKNDAEIIDRAETERQARTEAEANGLKDRVIAEAGVKEMVYPQRLLWSEWLLRGIREDNITAVIVFCLLLCIVPSALAISGYFVYTLLRTFL